MAIVIGYAISNFAAQLVEGAAAVVELIRFGFGVRLRTSGLAPLKQHLLEESLDGLVVLLLQFGVDDLQLRGQFQRVLPLQVVELVLE